MWWIAVATPARIPAAAPRQQSRRVWLTISMIVGTPRPSSPTIRAQVPRNSTSLEAFERLPSLSLSRWIWIGLRSPSGVKRGIRKQESPPSAWARTRKASHIGADMNHLWPVSSYSAPGPPPFSGVGDGRVGAHVRAALLLGHPHAAQRAGLVGRGAQLAVVAERGEARLPLGRELGLLAQRRDHRVGHRDRAADAGLGLRGDEHRRAGDVGAGLRLAPRQRVRAEADTGARAARARRGGTRPRRSGCRSGRGCAASAGSRSPRSPSGSPAPSRRRRRPRSPGPRPSRRPRGAAPRPGPGRTRRCCSPPAASPGWRPRGWRRRLAGAPSLPSPGLSHVRQQLPLQLGLELQRLGGREVGRLVQQPLRPPHRGRWPLGDLGGEPPRRGLRIVRRSG